MAWKRPDILASAGLATKLPVNVYNNLSDSWYTMLIGNYRSMHCKYWQFQLTLTTSSMSRPWWRRPRQRPWPWNVSQTSKMTSEGLTNGFKNLRFILSTFSWRGSVLFDLRWVINIIKQICVNYRKNYWVPSCLTLPQAKIRLSLCKSQLKVRELKSWSH